MNGPTCIDADTAASFVAGSLTGAEVANVQRHIDGCDSCRTLVSMVAKAETPSQAVTVHNPGPHTNPLLARGTKAGRFEVLEPLEAGGMGTIYVALDPKLGRKVALKAVRDRHADPSQLIREAQLMAQLSHPNVVPVHDVVESNGQVLIAMELVEGQSLRQWLAAQPRRWQQIADVFIAAGQGLAAAHRAGIVHGDVKPGNILVGHDGQVRVTDFGVSRLITDEHVHGLVRGTPAYMPPEQLDGAAADALADQYAFAVSLHEALHGALPGAASKNAHVPRSLSRLIARAMQREPAQRFVSMDAVVAALRRARSTRERWLVIGAATSVALAAFAYLKGTATAESAPCVAMAAQLRSPWDDSARAAMKRVFQHNALPYGDAAFTRLSGRLDGWNTGFAATKAEACEAGLVKRAVPAERLHAQLGCLADQARDVRALLGLMQEADGKMIDDADSFADRLGAPARCLEPTRAPTTATEGPKVDQLRELFARTRMLHVAGRFKELLPLAQDAAKQADELNDPVLQASAKVVLGNALARSGDAEGAAQQLRAAIRLADATQADRTRALAWVALLQVEYMRGKHQKVVELYDEVLGACERIGDDGLATEAMLQYGGSLGELNRSNEAQPIFEDAVRRRTRLYGEADRRTAFALSAYGNALSMQGDLKAGAEAHAKAVKIAEAAIGAEHPGVGTLVDNLGDDYLYGLQTKEAIAQLERGSRILEAAHGPKSRDFAMGQGDLGWAYLYDGRAEDALAAFERADQAWAAVFAQHPVRGMVMLGRQRALEKKGQPLSAPELEQALKLASAMPPFEKGRVQLALAEALPPSDAERAKGLVADAVKNLSTLKAPLIDREREAAQLWLDAHGAKK